jgi:hypothetical protein
MNKDNFQTLKTKVVQNYKTEKLYTIVFFFCAIFSLITALCMKNGLIHTNDKTLYEVFILWAIFPFTLHTIKGSVYLIVNRNSYLEAKCLLDNKNYL